MGDNYAPQDRKDPAAGRTAHSTPHAEIGDSGFDHGLWGPPHATELGLVLYATGELEKDEAVTVAEHLAACKLCATRLNEAADEGQLPGRDEIVTLASQLATEFRSELIIPTAVHSALIAPRPDVAPLPGQLWRLAWGETALLATILEIGETHVEVVPVTFDVAFAGPYTAVIPGKFTSLHLDLAIFGDLWAGVPAITLDRYVCDLTDDLGWLRAIRMAAFRGTAPPTPPDDRRLGDAMMDRHDPRRQYRDALHREITRLQHADLGSSADDARTVADLIESSGLDLMELAEVLEIDAATAMKIGRGDRGCRLGRRIASRIASESTLWI